MKKKCCVASVSKIKFRTCGRGLSFVSKGLLEILKWADSKKRHFVEGSDAIIMLFQLRQKIPFITVEDSDQTFIRAEMTYWRVQTSKVPANVNQGAEQTRYYQLVSIISLICPWESGRNTIETYPASTLDWDIRLVLLHCQLNQLSTWQWECWKFSLISDSVHWQTR